MNQQIPLSWGCTGNALSNQQSVDDEETTCSFNGIKPCQINQEKEKNPVNQEYPWHFKIFLSECRLVISQVCQVQKWLKINEQIFKTMTHTKSSNIRSCCEYLDDRE